MARHDDAAMSGGGKLSEGMRAPNQESELQELIRLRALVDALNRNDEVTAAELAGAPCWTRRPKQRATRRLEQRLPHSQG